MDESNYNRIFFDKTSIKLKNRTLAFMPTVDIFHVMRYYLEVGVFWKSASPNSRGESSISNSINCRKYIDFQFNFNFIEQSNLDKTNKIFFEARNSRLESRFHPLIVINLFICAVNDH